MNLDTYDLANRYSYIATRFEDFGRAVREYSNLVNDIVREVEYANELADELYSDDRIARSKFYERSYSKIVVMLQKVGLIETKND